MDGYEVIIALIIGILVLAVVSVAFIPRLIESDTNSTQKLNNTFSSAITTASHDSVRSAEKYEDKYWNELGQNREEI